MKIQRTCLMRILRTAVILACILEPGLGIATESSVNEQLVQAAKKGDLDRVKTLLARGADVNTKDKYGITALMGAVAAGNTELVKFLVHKGADVKAKREDGRTALMGAAAGRIIDRGLGGAGVYTEIPGNQENYLKVVQFLIEKGADVNARDEDGETALMVAAQSGNLEVVRFLVEKGADVNASDKYGRTALMGAILHADFSVVKLLADKGVDVNARSKFSRTALTCAAKMGNLEVV